MESREPVRVFPREIVTARPFLQRLEADLRTLSHLPMRLLWADRDIAFDARARAKWQRLFPDRTDHTLHGAGHYWQDDAGEEAALVIRDWMLAR